MSPENLMQSPPEVFTIWQRVINAMRNLAGMDPVERGNPHPGWIQKKRSGYKAGDDNRADMVDRPNTHSRG